MKKITPCLWFEGNLGEALEFYSTVFKDSEVISENRAPAGGPLPEGTLFTATFRLNDQEFLAINGGPAGFLYSEAFSLFISCDGQEEVDYYWDHLLDGGEPSQCGWLKDRYGISWQVVPVQMNTLLSDPDPVKASRVMQAMMGMIKLDIAGLQAAYDQN